MARTIHRSACVSDLNIYSSSLYMGFLLSPHFKLLPATQLPKCEKKKDIYDARKSDYEEKLHMRSVHRPYKCIHGGTEMS